MVSRRDFIEKTLFSSILMGISGCFEKKKTVQRGIDGPDILYFITKMEDQEQHKVKEGGRDTRDYYLNKFVLRNLQREKVFIPFRGHGITFIDEKIRNNIFISQRYGENSCLLSWKTKKVINQLTHTGGAIFNGHSSYDKKNNLLLSVEIEHYQESNQQGFIRLRDPLTLKMVREISSYGKAPHELYFDIDKQQIWICNDDHPYPSFCLIDYKTGKLLQKSMCKEAPKMGMAHLAQQGETFVLVGLNHSSLDEQESCLLVKEGNKSIYPLMVRSTSSFKLSGEILNTAISSQGQYAMTSSHMENVIVLWDLKNKKDLSYKQMIKPKGVTFINGLDQQFCCVLIHEFGVSLFDLKDKNLHHRLDLINFERNETPDSHVIKV
jgi:hypothetical protein